MFFVLMSEGLWGFFDFNHCDVKIKEDIKDYYENTNKLKEQILKIYLDGVLV